MTYRAIYTYGWDLAEDGVPKAVDRFRELGLDTVTIAGSYHAGKFLRPHGRRGKVYFPEDGTIYFRCDPARYGTIKPLVNSLLAKHDILRELTERSDIRTNVWLVLMHNTALGMRHVQSTIRNAFDDRYVYNLCPSAPETRAYALGLARDVTEAYPVSGLSLETPGFLPYAHGFHHEFALNRSNRWLDSLLGLCFCDHCTKEARKSGIDVRRLKEQVARDINDYLSSDVDFPPDMAEAFWMADVVYGGELRAFLDWRCTMVTSLVAEIRSVVRKDAQVAVIPSVARPTAGAWYEGSDLAALAKAAGIIEACFYETTPQRVLADLFDVRRRLDGHGRLRGILRPAYPDFSSLPEFLAAVQQLQKNGINELAFYNWGHLRDANVAWIGEALRFMSKAS